LKNKIEIFNENPTLGGFSIAVRDDWSFKIKRIHITAFEKEAYQKQFGETIMLERAFMEWWINYKQIQNSEASDSPVK
jgi:hypothetical protein